MSKSIYINKEKFIVKIDEYNNVQKKYFNLNIFENLGLHERLISLIERLKNYFVQYSEDNEKNKINIIIYSPTHGGYIPIKLSSIFNKIYLIGTTEHNLYNIQNNIDYYNIDNIVFFNILQEDVFQQNNIFFIPDSFDNFKLESILNKLTINLNTIIISNESKIFEEKFRFKYSLSKTKYNIYLNDNSKFMDIFKYYIENNYLYYDNLINLCVMVKNGGEQFEEFLKSNLNLIDRWTILDTGSTDNTINIINKILVGKKEGKLYQEPFINFKESRNKLLDLAGTSCKFTIMLDDSYIVRGDLRNFLDFVRGDQYSSSFSIYIDNNDIKYVSNRILKSANRLRYIYKIHEVIDDKNNIMINIPWEASNIFDNNPEYMQKRTNDRLLLDLKLLQEELDEDPNNPRTYYYFGQTYNLLGDYQKAFNYFMKRYEFMNSGFLQERFSAILRAARIANFNLNLKWENCEDLYLKANKIDDSRPEPLYFIGIHYYLKNNYSNAFNYLKKAFELGTPENSQFDIIMNLYKHFIPKFLTKICYQLNEFETGEKSSELFINYSINKTTPEYPEMYSWNLIFKKLNMYKGPKEIKFFPEKPIFCFVADGGFKPWTGSSILKEGVGGSETYIIEMAKYIQKSGLFQTYVFANTPNNQDEIFEGTIYKPLKSYYEFVNTTYIKHCMISRFSEYLPLSYKGWTENVYLVIHDLTPTGNVIPIDNKLKKIFCLTEWHVKYFTSLYPQLKNITVPFYYGCAFESNCIDNKKDENKANKVPYSFIYSSFPNRGLLELLQIWPKIYEVQNKATLNIYSDVNNKWCNDVEPEKMIQIKKLLEEYKQRPNGLGITYHGWVNKIILKNAWNTSDIWFYPCTFMETFCLTALEAAKTKTLAITNNLAALENTVGDRGVIIKGDPITNKWKQEAINKIIYYLDDKNNEEKNLLIEKNYKWASELTWSNQANKLLDEYILNNNLEYKNNFDLIQNTNELEICNRVLEYFISTNTKIKNNQQIQILDIFTYTGINLIYFLKNIPNSYGIGIDNFNLNHIEKSFKLNCMNSNIDENKFQSIYSNPLSKLIEFVKNNKKFDFIYISPNLNTYQLYSTLCLSWNLLDSNGILGISWDKELEIIINKFILDFKPNFKIINTQHKVWLEKVV